MARRGEERAREGRDRRKGSGGEGRGGGGGGGEVIGRGEREVESGGER